MMPKTLLTASIQAPERGSDIEKVIALILDGGAGSVLPALRPWMS
jgi:hypothetical protein